MPHPLLYEINTRCWLRELSNRHGHPVNLATVPESEFAGWQRLGFTHIWLMGVWTTGPVCRAEAFKHADLLNAYNFLLPDWSAGDILGSPYAIGDYRVPAALGGDEGLKAFRAELHRRGLKLILDFVPNHLGLDHAWLRERPELFVQSPNETHGVFRQTTVRGLRWLAHGKDPHFAPWVDTVQLDYRRAETRTAMLELLQSVADRCDGVRCDMAMLLLNNVFNQTWAKLPVHSQPPSPNEQRQLPLAWIHPPADPAPPTTEFWPDATAAIKRDHPEFVFLAEVYWGLDGHMQTMGFDYTYDKHLYDQLMYRSHAEVQRHLLATTPKYLESSAHFLENHDEPRVAMRLSPEEHRAAALLILALPGMRFLHEGQLTGYPHHLPVQLGHRPEVATNPAVAAIYDQLLPILRESAVGRGDAKMLCPRRAWHENPTAENFIVVQWQVRPMEFDLAVVNLAPCRSQCYVPLQIENLASRDWRMCDRLGGECYDRFGNDLAQGLYLDVAPHGAQLFRFQPL